MAAGTERSPSHLNIDGVPCPSAHMPQQNRHRFADGWQGSTVKAILDNPRYTGYAVFGRWHKNEVLLDPDDVSAGHVVRFRRAEQSRVVRSRQPAHPSIVSVEAFTEAQIRQRTRGAGDPRNWSSLERNTNGNNTKYLLRGLVRCGVCDRKMEGAAHRSAIMYRCRSRTLAPGSNALKDHPPTIYLREEAVTGALNRWIATLFEPSKRADTVATLVGGQHGQLVDTGRVEPARRKLADSQTRLRRHQAAIEAGVEPPALVDAINQAQAERAAAQAEIDRAPSAELLDKTAVERMVDTLGNMAKAIDRAPRSDLANLYQELRLDLRFQPAERAVDVTIRPRVANVRVRGGT